MRTFVAMCKALSSIAPLLARIEATDRRQIADQVKNDANQERNEERFKLILDAMQDKKFPPQKVFFDGQVYDAFEQMKKFVRMAKKELIIFLFRKWLVGNRAKGLLPEPLAIIG